MTERGLERPDVAALHAPNRPATEDAIRLVDGSQSWRRRVERLGEVLDTAGTASHWHLQRKRTFAADPRAVVGRLVERASSRLNPQGHQLIQTGHSRIARNRLAWMSLDARRARSPGSRRGDRVYGATWPVAGVTLMAVWWRLSGWTKPRTSQPGRDGTPR
jgi:hypothetical protein